MSEYGDLHLHTDFSGGGTLTPSQLMDRINKYNMRAKEKLSHIAITDHNTIDGIKIAQKKARAYKLELIPGIEFKCKLDDYGELKVDILGYMIDTESRPLKRGLNKLKRYEGQWLINTIKLLNKELEKQGKRRVKETDIKSITRPASISVDHVTKALVRLGIEEDQGTAKRKYFEEGGPAYVKLELPSADLVIGLIHDAGGEAVLAHPVYYRNRESVIKDLVGLGIDGIEVYHSDHDSKIVRILKEQAKKHGKMVYGGSDFHGEDSQAHGEFSFGNIRSSFPYAKIGDKRGRLPKKYTKMIAELWKVKHKR